MAAIEIQKSLHGFAEYSVVKALKCKEQTSDASTDYAFSVFGKDTRQYHHVDGWSGR